MKAAEVKEMLEFLADKLYKAATEDQPMFEKVYTTVGKIYDRLKKKEAEKDENVLLLERPIEDINQSVINQLFGID